MPLKIYYLDDEKDLTDLFKEEFESADVQVLGLNNPDQAIKTIQENPPDLLFLDYLLPHTTGKAIALKLAPEIPKVLITGNLSVTEAELFLKVVYKPLNSAEIHQFIQSFLSKKA